MDPVLAVIPRDFVWETKSPVYDFHASVVEFPTRILVLPSVVSLGGIEMWVKPVSTLIVDEFFVIVKFDFLLLLVESTRTQLDMGSAAFFLVVVVSVTVISEKYCENGDRDDES